MQNILREDLSNVQVVGKKYPNILAASQDKRMSEYFVNKIHFY